MLRAMHLSLSKAASPPTGWLAYAAGRPGDRPPLRRPCLWLGVVWQLVRAVPSFELAISQAIYHSKWLLGRFLGLMKGIEGQATETAA
jgi:hypothetical protein